MISASPHQYRADGRARGRPEPVLDAALAQAAGPELQGAPAILTLMHLAKRMDVSYKFLRSVIASKEGTHYRDFHISKRDGGGRRIARARHPRLWRAAAGDGSIGLSLRLMAPARRPC